MVIKYFVGVAVFLILPFTHSENSEINVVLKHSTSFINVKYVKNMTSTCKPINRTTSIASMDVYFQPGVVLSSPLYVEYITNKKFATQYRQFMVNLKFDLCDFLKFKNHPAYNMVFDNVNRSDTNMLDPCPFKGHRFVKPYYTSYSNMPPMIPVGMWRSDVKITKGLADQTEEEVLRYHDYYEITPKGIIEF